MELSLKLIVRVLDQAIAPLRKIVGGVNGLDEAVNKLAGSKKRAAEAPIVKETEAQRLRRLATAAREAGAELEKTGKVNARMVEAMGGFEKFEQMARMGVEKYTRALEKEAQAAEKATGAQDRLGKKTSQAGGHARRSAGMFHILGDAFKYSLAYGVAFAAIMGVVSLIKAPFVFAGKLFKAGLELGKSAAEIEDAARKLGVSSDLVQGLQFGFTKNNMDPKGAVQMLEALGKAQVDALRHGKSQAVAFKALGIEHLRYGKTLVPLPTLLDQVADGMSRVTSATKRQYLAQLLFGAEGKSLEPLLRNGAKGFKAMVAEGRRLGFILTPEQIEAGRQFNANWLALKFTFMGLRNEVVGALLPVFNDLTKAVTVFFQDPKNRGVLTKAVGDFATKLKADLPRLIPAITRLLQALFEIIENVDWAGVASGITRVANAFAWLTKKDALGQSNFVTLTSLVNPAGALWTGLKAIADVGKELQAALTFDLPPWAKAMLGGLGFFPGFGPLAIAAGAYDRSRPAAAAGTGRAPNLVSPQTFGGRLTVVVEDQRVRVKSLQTNDPWDLHVDRGALLAGR